MIDCKSAKEQPYNWSYEIFVGIFTLTIMLMFLAKDLHERLTKLPSSTKKLNTKTLPEIEDDSWYSYFYEF